MCQDCKNWEIQERLFWRGLKGSGSALVSPVVGKGVGEGVIVGTGVAGGKVVVLGAAVVVGTGVAGGKVVVLGAAVVVGTGVAAA